MTIPTSTNPTITIEGNTLTVGGNIGSSNNSLTKTGTGALTLSGANSHTGGTTLSNGTLNINNASALGTGTFTIASGTTIDNTSGSSITNSNNNTRTWNGGFNFTGSNSLDLGVGSVALNASSNIAVAANILTVGDHLRDGYGLTKSDAGTLTLSGANTYDCCGGSRLAGILGIARYGSLSSSGLGDIVGIRYHF